METLDELAITTQDVQNLTTLWGEVSGSMNELLRTDNANGTTQPGLELEPQPTA